MRATVLALLALVFVGCGGGGQVLDHSPDSAGLPDGEISLSEPLAVYTPGLEPTFPTVAAQGTSANGTLTLRDQNTPGPTHAFILDGLRYVSPDTGRSYDFNLPTLTVKEWADDVPVSLHRFKMQ